MAESYFWPLAMSYEPKYSTARKIVGKLVACVCLLDDTYDAYGTIEELELFTEAMQRLIRVQNILTIFYLFLSCYLSTYLWATR